MSMVRKNPLPPGCYWCVTRRVGFVPEEELRRLDRRKEGSGHVVAGSEVHHVLHLHSERPCHLALWCRLSEYRRRQRQVAIGRCGASSRADRCGDLIAY